MLTITSALYDCMVSSDVMYGKHLLGLLSVLSGINTNKNRKSQFNKSRINSNDSMNTQIHKLPD